MKSNAPRFLFALLGLTLSAHLAHATLINGSGGSSFGGAVTGGSLNVTDDGSTISILFTRGPGTFNDNLVLYFDSVAGGFANTSLFDDNADGGREAISGFSDPDRTLATFAPGFGADFAISLTNSFAGLFDLNAGGDNSHTFIAGVGQSLSGLNNSASYAMQFTLAQIGLTPGNTFSLVGTYISPTAFRSDETFVGATTTAGFTGSVNWSSSQSHTTVPEPGTVTLILIAVAAASARRKRH